MICKRCGATIGNNIISVNGAIYCENCARELGIDEAFRNQTTLFEQAFPMFEEMANSILGNSNNLEFANTKIRCPRCKMTLRQFETSGQAGCIECFNTFNETILKSLLKRQGSDEYKGRKPGEASSLSEGIRTNTSDDTTASVDKVVSVNEEGVVDNNKEKQDATPVIEETKVNIADFNCESLDAFSDKELEAGMKDAAAAENYPLAMRLRDELKKRKEGN